MKNYEILPNPIYDNVFKYLLEDIESAKIILSVLSNRNITDLHYESGNFTEKKTDFDKEIKILEIENKANKKKQDANKTEWQLIDTELELQKSKVKDPHTGNDIARAHLDFIATIKDPSGKEEHIMIELQKENDPSDIYRFKRYIAKNFIKKVERTKINSRTKVPEKQIVSLPILPIFILNFKIENDIKDLVLHVNNETRGFYTKKILKKPNEFIDNLTYGLIIVQLAHLDTIKENMLQFLTTEELKRTYKLLSFFDQSLIHNNNRHRLRLPTEQMPKDFGRIVNRLKSASLDNPDLEEEMFAEDEYIQMLKNKYRTINNLSDELSSTTKKLRNTTKKLDKEKLIRKIAEKQRKEAEEQRKEAEEQKKEAEEQKKQEKHKRLKAEEQKKLAEEQKKEEKYKRLKAEEHIAFLEKKLREKK